MAAINASTILLYADGVVIAAQRNCTINVSQNLFDVTTKSSGGWAEHGNGLRTFTVDFDGLVSTTGKSASELFAYIIGRTSLLLVIDGFDYPYVMQVDLANSSVTGPMEDATSLSGSFVVLGTPYYLDSSMPQLITDPDAGGHNYDTLTVSGISITTAINDSGAAYCQTNTISVTDTGVYKFIVFIFDSLVGEAPSVGLYDNTSAFISNVAQLAAGLNMVTLICTSTDASASLRITNSAQSAFVTSNMYLFRES